MSKVIDLGEKREEKECQCEECNCEKVVEKSISELTKEELQDAVDSLIGEIAYKDALLLIATNKLGGSFVSKEDEDGNLLDAYVKQDIRLDIVPSTDREISVSIVENKTE